LIEITAIAKNRSTRPVKATMIIDIIDETDNIGPSLLRDSRLFTAGCYTMLVLSCSVSEILQLLCATDPIPIPP